MTNIEQKLNISFARVKQDISGLWNGVYDLRDDNIKIRYRLSKIEESQRQILEALAGNKAEQKTFVLNKTNSKLHAGNCFFAKNIKPENMVFFSSEEAIKGLSSHRCACMNA